MRLAVICLIFILCLLTGCSNSEKSSGNKVNDTQQTSADDRFRQGVYHKSSGIRW